MAGKRKDPRGGAPGGTSSPRYRGTLEVQRGALEDLTYWVETDRKIALKVLRLIEAARRDPFSGEGKPEPLKELGSDIWSRRITSADRLVYRVTSTGIDVLQARYHY